MKPKILLLSGTHGDETAIIPSIFKSLEQYRAQLPPCLYIPYLSPSACRKQTRQNGSGININRYFFDSATDPEVISGQKLLRDHTFDFCFDFHMDTQFDSFYLYTNFGFDPIVKKLFYNSIMESQIALFNGIDDPNDQTLRNQIDNGYLLDKNENKGSTWRWLLDRGITQKVVTFEIPVHIEEREQTILIDLIFKNLIVPMTKD